MSTSHSHPPTAPPQTLRGLQQRVDDWIQQFEEGYFPPLVNLARLTEESGELSRALSHHLGVKKPKKGEAKGDVKEEIADILFVLICLANPLGIDLEEAMDAMLTKIDKRDRSRWTLKTPDVPAKPLDFNKK